MKRIAASNSDDRVASETPSSVAPKRSRLRNVTSILGMTVLVQSIGLVTGAITARMLGVSGRGLLAAMTVWPSAIANAGDLGGPIAFTYQSAKSPVVRGSLVRNALTIAFLQSVALTLIGIPIMAFVLRDHPEHLLAAAVFLVLFMPLNLLGRYFMALHQGAQDFKLFNRVRLVLALSYAIGIGSLLAFGVNSVAPVIAAVVASNICATIVASTGLKLRDSLRRRFDRPLARETFVFGAKAHIGNLTPVDSLQLDVALVVLLLGTHAAGLYVVGTSAANVIRSQGAGIGLVALASVASSTTRQQPAVIGVFFKGAAVLLVGAAATVFLLAGELVPAIYGSEFDGAVPIVRILVIGIVAAALRQVLGDCLRGAGNPVAGTLAEALSWVVAIVSLVILVPTLGAQGAALAVSISYFSALLLLVFLARSVGVAASDLLIPRRSDAAFFWHALSSRIIMRSADRTPE